MKEKHSQRADLWLAMGIGVMVSNGYWGWGREGLGVWDQQTTIYRMNKQQGPTLQDREQYSTSCDKP